MKNEKFGRWTVIEEVSRSKSGDRRMLCVCDCGKQKAVFLNSLRSGKSTSCGCYHRENASRVHTTHGLSATSTYNSWHSMRKRCNNPEDPNYHYYGGRGITVCDEWSTFANFLADMGERPKGKTLDRIDNDKGYSKANCRWATDHQQRENRRTQRRNGTGITGVRHHKRKGVDMYQARMTVEGVNMTLYYGPDFLQATCARKSAENHYRGPQ